MDNLNDKGWTTVSGGGGANTLDLKTIPGQPVEGTFLSYTSFETKKGTQYKYAFMGPEGEPFEIYGMTAFNSILQQAKSGERYRLTFVGKIKTKSGNDFNQVDVQKYVGEGASAAPAGVPSTTPTSKVPF